MDEEKKQELNRAITTLSTFCKKQKYCDTCPLCGPACLGDDIDNHSMPMDWYEIK